MIYMENVFICITAPLLVAILCLDKRSRRSIGFFITGMSMCLLSAYINTLLAGYYGVDVVQAAVEIAPVVEETMKLLPPLFFLLVFIPSQSDARSSILFVAAGFATFENVCYLIEHGTSDLLFLLMRGFGTGAMHIVCGAIVGHGLLYVWKQPWLKAAGIFSLLCMAMTFHSIYNLLLSADGAVRTIGLIIPIITVVLSIGTSRLLKSRRLRAK